MASLKSIISYAIPSITALLGLLWFFRRKKDGGQKTIANSPAQISETDFEIEPKETTLTNNENELMDTTTKTAEMEIGLLSAQTENLQLAVEETISKGNAYTAFSTECKSVTTQEQTTLLDSSSNSINTSQNHTVNEECEQMLSKPLACTNVSECASDVTKQDLENASSLRKQQFEITAEFQLTENVADTSHDLATTECQSENVPLLDLSNVNTAQEDSSPKQTSASYCQNSQSIQMSASCTSKVPMSLNKDCSSLDAANVDTLNVSCKTTEDPFAESQKCEEVSSTEAEDDELAEESSEVENNSEVQSLPTCTADQLPNSDQQDLSSLQNDDLQSATETNNDIVNEDWKNEGDADSCTTHMSSDESKTEFESQSVETERLSSDMLLDTSTTSDLTSQSADTSTNSDVMLQSQDTSDTNDDIVSHGNTENRSQITNTHAATPVSDAKSASEVMSDDDSTSCDKEVELKISSAEVLSCDTTSVGDTSREKDEKESRENNNNSDSVHRVISANLETAAENSVVQQTDSPGCDNNSEASNDSGRGGSVTEPLLVLQTPENQIQRYEFNFPSDLCGRLIGKFGKNINYLKEMSGAHISLKNNPFTPDFQICLIEGKQAEIDKALACIRKKFPRHQYPQVDLTPIGQPQPAEIPLLMPDIMQLSLPESVSVDIVISNIVDAGHIFVQQPTHPSFPSLERLNSFMMACYNQSQMVPGLPRPIEVGVICACFSGGGWYRAQIMLMIEETDECDVKYVDYGGYARVQASMLKQIRSDFMTLPFQAVECYMGNITPLQDEEYFSEQASTVLQEITEGKMLQAQVINIAEDGLPYVHIYRVSGNRVLFINRELVNHHVVRWIEILQ